MQVHYFGVLLQTMLLQKVGYVATYGNELGLYWIPCTCEWYTLLLCLYLLSQVTDVRPKLAVVESGSKDYAHADDVPYKPKGGDIAQDGRARFVVYQMFSSMYIVYVFLHIYNGCLSMGRKKLCHNIIPSVFCQFWLFVHNTTAVTWFIMNVLCFTPDIFVNCYIACYWNIILMSC